MLPGANVTISSEHGRALTTGSQGDFRFLNLDPGPTRSTVTLAASHHRDPRGQGHDRRQRRPGVRHEGRDGRGDGRGHGRDAGRRHQEDAAPPPHIDSEELTRCRRRATPGPCCDRAGRARRPRQHRGQRERPAGRLRGQGLARRTTRSGTSTASSITDMAANGASPTYFDFDAFEEINVSTGGDDLKVATGGIGINFVTKRGTNAFHGGGAASWPRRACSRSQPARASSPDDPRARRRHATRPTTSSRSRTRAPSWAARSSRTSSGSRAPTASRTSALHRLNQTAGQDPAQELQRQAELAGRARRQVSVFWFRGEKVKFGRGAGLPASRSRTACSGTRATLRRRRHAPAGSGSRVDHIFSPTSS